MRCAIYFSPREDDPLTVAAVRWIGRDAYTGARMGEAETPGLLDCDRAFLTAPVRRYGFHGTLKAPFSIADGESLLALERALHRFAAKRSLVRLPKMEIARIDDFFALVPSSPSCELFALAADIVTSFDRFRAPLDELALARRGRSMLSERQFANLLRWGYPFILEDFRFHLALTGPVPSPEREHVRTVLQHYFGELATAPLDIDQLALFTEPEPYAPFLIRSVHPLVPKIVRKSA